MRFVKDSPLELGFRMWQLRPPQPSLTVVAKGTFDLGAGEVATFAAEQVPATGEVYVDDDVEMALARPSDYALLKPVGEAMVVGKAWAPGGRPATAVACRFRLGALEKRFAVFGDRRWTSGVVTGVSSPTPFTEMPLHMGRAYGGPGFAKNPWGRGRKEQPTEDGELAVMLPNVEDPRALVDSPSASPDPVVLAGLPMMWPDRRRYAGTYGSAYMEKRWPWLPEDFDWRFFLEAPPDLRLRQGYFRGDEPIEVEGLHPEQTKLRSRLPRIAPRVCIDLVPREGDPPVWREVALNLDTAVWDAELGKLLLTWRGVVEVPSETLEEVRYLFVAHDPLDGAQRSAEALRARCQELLREEELEEEEAEGEPPPQVEEAAPEVAEDEDEDEDDDEEALSPEDAALEAKLAELAALQPAEPPPLAPADPLAALAAMKASGQAVPPELEASLRALVTPPEEEDEPPEEVIPEPAPDPEGRALLEAKLAAGEPLTDLDLSGLDLRGLDLSRQDLSGSILHEANLEKVRLDEASLVGCVLIRANLFHASLARADLRDADLTEANLEGADLIGATLEDADASGARMVTVRLQEASAARAIFVRANLEGSLMTRADFTEADFEEANLARVNAGESNFSAATLERAKAPGAVFDRARMTGAKAEGLHAEEARFGGIDAEDSFWPEAILSRSDFSLSRLTRADFTGAVLIGTELDGCAVREGRFDRANAHSLKARKADLMEASFESAILSFADLRGSNLFTAQLWRARLDSAQLAHANLAGTILET